MYSVNHVHCGEYNEDKQEEQYPLEGYSKPIEGIVHRLLEYNFLSSLYLWCMALNVGVYKYTQYNHSGCCVQNINKKGILYGLYVGIQHCSSILKYMVLT